jgi:hypothetical protein
MIVDEFEMTGDLKGDSVLESVKIRRNKCFKEEFAGFDCIKPINIIIGRNNSGKSVLLDMVEFLVKTCRIYGSIKDTDEVSAILDGNSEFLFAGILSEEKLKRIFPENAYGGHISGSHWAVGSKLRTCPIEFCVARGLKTLSVKLLELPFLPSRFPYSQWDDATIKKHNEAACNVIAEKVGREFVPDALMSRTYRRLAAERDIVPEDQSDGLSLGVNGTGAANIIRAFLNDAKFDRDIIRISFLEGLNKIFEPDNTFSEIVPRRLETNQWEIFLNEKKKGLIPLSKSGSGIKTILLVLLNLLTIPKIPGNPTELKNYIFAFEELENNLHPSLLRRLYRFIENFVERKQSVFFITTHSNVVIDFFSQSDSAQIIHVTHDGEQAKTETVQHFVGHNAILDDLGVRASDLLQANGIVWLEGPSDRIYFNKWIEIYSNGALHEHRDYECAFYGGAVLSHHQATAPNDEGDFINIFRVNRNAILLADSDKTNKSCQLKKRVIRMKKQIESTRGIIWTFKAKEIENYIPPESIQNAFKLEKELPPLHKHLVFDSYRRKAGFGKNFDKVKFARQVTLFLTKESLASRFDLPEMMETICNAIVTWQAKSK